MHDEVDYFNKGIFNDTWTKSVQERKRDDPHLTKKAQKETMEARQEASLVEIDISIANSRIKDLENQRDMSNS